MFTDIQDCLRFHSHHHQTITKHGSNAIQYNVPPSNEHIIVVLECRIGANKVNSKNQSGEQLTLSIGRLPEIKFAFQHISSSRIGPPLTLQGGYRQQTMEDEIVAGERDQRGWQMCDVHQGCPHGHNLKVC